MNAILGLIVVGLFAYVGAALMKRPRMSLVWRVFAGSGVAFFGVGVVLGPHGTELLTPETLDSLDTFINLGLGWIGFLFGLQLRILDLRKVPGRQYLGSLVQALITFGVVAAGMYGLVLLLAPPEVSAELVAAAVLGLAAIASTSTPTTPALVCRELRSCGPLGPALQLMTSFDALVAILALGIPQCFAQPTLVPGVAGGFLSLAIATCVGLLIGILFHLLTLYRYSDDQLLVVIIGSVVFTAGAAYSLGLSPLFVSVVAGTTVANLVHERHRTLRVFLSVEQPSYLLMTALAGALWAPGSGAVFVLAGSFVLCRVAGKLLGGAVATPLAGLQTRGRLGLGPGLLGHGGMAVALAVSLQQSYPGPVGNTALTATIASVLATTFLAPKTTTAMLASNEEVS